MASTPSTDCDRGGYHRWRRRSGKSTPPRKKKERRPRQRAYNKKRKKERKHGTENPGPRGKIAQKGEWEKGGRAPSARTAKKVAVQLEKTFCKKKRGPYEIDGSAHRLHRCVRGPCRLYLAPKKSRPRKKREETKRISFLEKETRMQRPRRRLPQGPRQAKKGAPKQATREKSASACLPSCGGPFCCAVRRCNCARRPLWPIGRQASARRVDRAADHCNRLLGCMEATPKRKKKRIKNASQKKRLGTKARTNAQHMACGCCRQKTDADECVGKWTPLPPAGTAPHIFSLFFSYTLLFFCLQTKNKLSASPPVRPMGCSDTFFSFFLPALLLSLPLARGGAANCLALRRLSPANNTNLPRDAGALDNKSNALPRKASKLREKKRIISKRERHVVTKKGGGERRQR